MKRCGALGLLLATGALSMFITDTGVVVVDTKLSGYGPQLLAKIRTVTDKPVTHNMYEELKQ
jgi:hypothetical protein